MSKNLSISTIERQNVLNNRFAVEAIQKALNIEAMFFDGQYCFTKQMVADFYEVDNSTIERYLTSHSDELQFNGYFLCRGKPLKEFKLQFGRLINNETKTTVLSLFNFRAFLNIGMLLSESEKAKQVRSLILDIVIATIHERIGGGTKYINRRDANYIPSAIAEINYRKSLTSAINQCVDGHQTMKYAQITDYIYKAVFKENAKEYREILKLKENDKPRETMYAEVLLMIAAFEYGVGYEIKEKFKSNGEQLLSMQEV
ncbi:MAG: DNA-binding protein, partial [Bacteroidales bacterium]|nr:DNA-binding protein [Bacteroidales bacterium]